MKVIMFKVHNCKECPVGSRRITSWPHSEPVCELFMDENKPRRRGRVIDENVFNISIPSWCPLDNMIEVEDDEYEITANNREKDPKFNWSRLKDTLVTWKEIV